MDKNAFWKWFDNFAAPKLDAREVSFRKIFQYLDTCVTPVTIVETGCARIPDNWEDDGQSTILFEHYAKHNHPQAIVHSIELDVEAVKSCQAMVGPHVALHQGDSVAVLPHLAKRLTAEERTIALLYLDSFDLDMENPIPSAVHHLKELVSIASVISPTTLVVVDDCVLTCQIVFDKDDSFKICGDPTIGGKGMYVAEYAQQVQAQLEFSHYQAGWTNMVQS